MRPGSILLLLTLWLVPGLVRGATVLTTVLSGAEESPPNNSLASGSATFTLNDAHTAMSYVVNFTALEAGLTGAHLHRSSVGPGGALSIGLAPPVGATSATFSGNLAGLSAATVADLLAGHYYLNIHSTVYPDGEIRGTLVVDAGSAGSRGTWGRIKALYR
jgi:hypothetical protein